MSNNGNTPKTLLTVTLKDGSMKVEFDKCNTALLSHAIRLASLHLDNMLIGHDAQKETSEIAISENLLKRLRL